MGNRPLIPGQVNFDVRLHRAPLAHPIAVSVPVPGGAQLNIVGGLTPLEHVASQVLSGLAAPIVGEMLAATDPQAAAASKMAGVAAAVQLAEALLAECATRQASPPQQPSSPFEN